MEHKEYLEKVAKLQIEFDLAKEKLMREFVDANNPHKVGDIIEDHIGKAQIARISYSYGGFSDKPCAVYHCFDITKKGRRVYQFDLIN